MTPNAAAIEKPMLFSGAMVKAILDGTKTQTRRILKPVPEKYDSALIKPEIIGCCYHTDKWQWQDEHGNCMCRNKRPYAIKCPYPVGSCIWVKETWQHVVKDMPPTKGCRVLYRADDSEGFVTDSWRPSIFMPRWASRITLEVTDVRVERLQDISEADAVAEGVTIRADAVMAASLANDTPARMEFWDLWKSINGPDSWDANPWVWAYTFKPIALTTAREVAG